MFGDWTTCTTSCGGGIQSRNRTVRTPEGHGGDLCVGNAMEIKACNTMLCPGGNIIQLSISGINVIILLLNLNYLLLYILLV